MSLLHSEPRVADNENLNQADYGELRKYAAVNQSYPHKPPQSMIRLWCSESNEYIDSAAFSGMREFTMYDVYRYHDNQMFFTFMLLTARRGAYHCDSFGVQGRWFDKHIVTAHRNDIHDYDAALHKHVNNWERCELTGTDISTKCRAYLDSYWHYTRADQSPDAMRRLVYRLAPNRTKDFMWLRERHLWQLRNICKQQYCGTWMNLRTWLLRQTLHDDTRRALGGRPGRLKCNQQRSRGPADSRGMRRIRTNRGIKGT